MQRLLSLLIMGIAGALGGLGAQAFVLPYLASHASFQEWKFIQDWNARTLVVNPVSELIIDRAEAPAKTVEKVKNSIVVVQSASGQAGSGLIATSDGLVITLASFVPSGFPVSLYIAEEKEAITEVQVLKRDFQNNLALLKIEKTNLQTMGFASLESLKPGVWLLLAGKALQQEGGVLVLVNEGIIRRITQGEQLAPAIETTIRETSLFKGAPLFTLEGQVAGLATLDAQGRISAIPPSVLRSFLGL